MYIRRATTRGRKPRAGPWRSAKPGKLDTKAIGVLRPPGAFAGSRPPGGEVRSPGNSLRGIHALKTLRLHGVLRQKFGPEFKLDARSPREAVYALSCVLPGFRAHLQEHSLPGYRLFVGREARQRDHLDMPSSDREVIRLVPVVAGSGNTLKSIATVIVGAALIYFSGGIGGALGNAVMGGGYAGIGAGTVFSSAVSSIGWGLALAGVSSLLFTPPRPTPAGQTERPENRPSYIFDGPVNTTRQGNAVPVLYGRLLIGSQVISAGLRAHPITP